MNYEALYRRTRNTNFVDDSLAYGNHSRILAVLLH